jgi:16S rRNA (uracil1498-N3)-methyltransferase
MIDALRHSSAHVFVGDVAVPFLSDDDSHHLAKVLRLRIGESVTCSDGGGSWRECSWNGGVLVPTSDVITAAAPAAALTVVVAPVKGDKTDLVIEKLVEIGIDHIVILAPLDHSVVRWSGDKIEQVMARYTRIAHAAAMQSRRVFLPTVTGPVSLGSVLGPQVAFAEPGGTASWSQVTTLVIGPEGGFSATELAMAPSTINLGSGILRAETAAIVGSALMVAHWRG